MLLAPEFREKMWLGISESPVLVDLANFHSNLIFYLDQKHLVL